MERRWNGVGTALERNISGVMRVRHSRRKASPFPTDVPKDLKADPIVCM